MSPLGLRAGVAAKYNTVKAGIRCAVSDDAVINTPAAKDTLGGFFYQENI